MPPVAIIAGAAAVAGAAVKAVGDSQAAEAKAQADEFNASVKGQQALQAKAQAAEEARISQVHSASVIGQEQASYGASGVSGGSGSAQDVLQAAATNAEMDALNIQHKGDLEAWALRTGAQLDNSAASNARTAGGFAVAGDVIGGVSGGASAALGKG